MIGIKQGKKYVKTLEILIQKVNSYLRFKADLHGICPLIHIDIKEIRTL